MSFTYVITETERENLPNGVYREKLTSVEEKIYSYQGEMISYVEVKWDVLSPEIYKGREEIETFYIGHSDAKRASTAKWKFSELCKQMTGLKTGEALDTKSLIGKEALVTVENNFSEKNGKTYQNIVNRVLQPSQSNHGSVLEDSNPEKTAAILAMAGIQMPTTPVASGQPLNDEVPF